MRMNKVMKGTALTALAAATWLAAGTTDASAAKAENPIDIEDVIVNTYKQTLTVDVEEGKAKEVHIGIGTFNKNKSTVKVSAWDVYEVGEYEEWDEYDEGTSGFGVSGVDLSKLNSTKDSYIAVKTDKSDPVYIKVPAAVKGQTAKYNPGNNHLDITKIKQGTSSDIKPETLDWQYRTSYGSWKFFTPYGTDDKGTVIQNEIFQEFQQQGASLYVRTGATEGGYYDETEKKYYNMKPLGTVKDANDKGSDPVEYPLYESGSLPGKESKVSIKKQANGPAVGVDYAKNTVKLAKDVEFRMILGSDYFSTELAGVKSDAKVEVEKFFEATTSSSIAKAEADAATSGVLEVRKKADATKKKSASKWTIVKLDKPQEMAIKAAKADDLKDGGIVTTNSAVSFAVTNGSISVKYIYKGTGDKAKYSDKVEITNSDSKLDYEVVIKSSVPASTDKATKVKKGGKNAKVTAKKGDTIYIRVAGDKKEKRFAGKYTVVAKTIY